MTKANIIKTNIYLFMFFLFNNFIAKNVYGQVDPITINPPEKGITSIGKLISSGITAAIIISALLTFVYLVWGGIEWLTSGGDKTKMEEARGKITAAVIGLAIVAAAYAVMTLIAQFFGLDLGNLTFPTAVGQ